ncbi:MAG: hypothetical protein ACRDRH_04830 [Pseudonocardia sp.]
MSNEDGGGSGCAQRGPHLFADLGAQPGVQRRERLIEEHERRGQRPGQRHPLLTRGPDERPVGKAVGRENPSETPTTAATNLSPANRQQPSRAGTAARATPRPPEWWLGRRLGTPPGQHGG